MKKILLTTAVAIICMLTSFGQGGSWDWARLFDKIGDINPESFHMKMAVDGNNNLYIEGVFRDNINIGTETFVNKGNYDIFLCSFDAIGNFRWANAISSNHIDDIGGLVVDGNNVYISGSFRGSNLYFTDTDSIINDSHYDAFVAHYSTDGTFQRAKKLFWGQDQQRLRDMVLDKNNKFLVFIAQYTSQLVYNNGIEDDTLFVQGVKDFVIARYDISTGFSDLQFNDLNTFYSDQSSTNFKHVNNSVIGSTHTGYFVTGDIFGKVWFTPADSIVGTNTTKSDALVFKLDKNLDLVWARRGGSVSNDHVNSSNSDKSGNIFIAGKYEGTVTFDSTATRQSALTKKFGAQDLYVAKYNREGRLLWLKCYGYAGNDDAFGMAISDKYIQVAGNVSDLGNTNTGFWRFNVNGTYINRGEIYGDGEDIGKDVAFDSEGNTLITGYFDSDTLLFGPEEDADTFLVNNTGFFDGFVGKYQYPLTIVRDTIINVSCNGGNNGRIVLHGEFGVPPYSWSWEHDPANQTPIAEDLPAGTYIVTLTDSDSPPNMVKDTIEIAEPDALVIDRVITDVSCYNGSDGEIGIIPSGGTIPYIYLWSGGSGLNPTDSSQTELGAGVYNVRVTDKNGCFLDSSFIVNQPSELVIDNLVKWDIYPCTSGNGAAKVYVSGGTPAYTYLWSNSGTTDSIGSLEKGSYNVQVTDANGCQKTSGLVSIIDSCQVNIEVVNVVDVTCYGAAEGIIQLTAFGGERPYTYYWTPDVGHNDSIADDLIAGLYQIVVEDNIGEKDTVDVEIKQPDTLFATAILVDVICYGDSTGSINQTVSGGTPPYFHKWWPTGDTTEDLNNIPAGNYKDSITDANGCQIVKSYTIIQNSQIKVDKYTIDSVRCFGLNDGAIDINSVSGGIPPYEYYWLKSDWNPQDGLTNPDIEDLFAGNYYLTIIDAAECTMQDTVPVPQPDLLQVFPDSIKPSCPGRVDGEGWVVATGGNGGYSFTWEPSGKTGDHVENMPAATYTVTVEDYKQCMADTLVPIPENPEITITLDTIINILCTDSINGEICITIGGGTPPYELVWNPDGETTMCIENKPAGTYSVQVTDAADCPAISPNYEILDLSLPIDYKVDIVDSVNCFGGDDGMIRLAAISGNTPFMYSIDGGETFQPDGEFSGLTASDYYIVVKDTNNCLEISDTAVTVSQPNPLEIESVSIIPDTNETGVGEIMIILVVNSGTEPYTFTMDEGTPQSTGEFNNVLTGQHTIVITDDNSCGPIDTTVTVANEIVGLFNHSYTGSINLYPNPTTGKLTVEIENAEARDMVMEIINLQGQVILKRELEYNGEPRFVEIIDMGKAKGTYFMRVDGLPVNTKIVVE